MKKGKEVSHGEQIVACAGRRGADRGTVPQIMGNREGDTAAALMAVCMAMGPVGHIFYVDVDLDCSVFSPFSCRMEKYAQSMLRFESLHALFAFGVWTIFLRVDVPEPA